jgi:hypothetical protein
MAILHLHSTLCLLTSQDLNEETMGMHRECMFAHSLHFVYSDIRLIHLFITQWSVARGGIVTMRPRTMSREIIRICWYTPSRFPPHAIRYSTMRNSVFRLPPHQSPTRFPDSLYIRYRFCIKRLHQYRTLIAVGACG